jgi:NADH dehydrogenase FAD-containing subunit
MATRKPSRRLRHDPRRPAADAPDFIRVSPLADDAGWVDVDQNTLRHKTFDNIWSLGDVMNAPERQDRRGGAQAGADRGQQRDG